MAKEALHGVNTIPVAGQALLLTTTSGGTAIHLVRPVENDTRGRPAVHDFHLEPEFTERVPSASRYDAAALSEPRWSEVTLCGRTWAVMVGGEAGPVTEYCDPAFAPSCSRCMAIIDKLFPAPDVDARLPLVAQLVAQLLVEHGLAQIYHVPGDQVSALRKEIRRRVRDLSGHPIKTNYVGGVIYAECEPVYEIHAMTYQRAAVEAVPSFLTGSDESALPSLPDWNVYWGNWAVS